MDIKAHCPIHANYAEFYYGTLNKWGLDGNPAPFKIQYPMKNRNKGTC
jgi:hypothetical protein